MPYFPPSKVYVPLEELVNTHMPNFTYQLQFKSGELEKAISTRDEIRQFLIGLYGGMTDNGKPGVDVSKGVLLENLKGLKPSKLLSKEVRTNQSWLRQVVFGELTDNWCFIQEIEYYTDEFARHGIHGPRKSLSPPLRFICM